MNKGFLIFSQDTAENQFSKYAYALALSIKKNCPNSSVSLVTDNIPEKYRYVFDNIIDIPWNTTTTPSMFAAENRWKLYHCTPYDETIVLDSDCLVLNDISNYWRFFEHYSVYYTSQILDYRGNVISEDPFYRKCFTANNLPNFYSALHYFKKTEEAKEFYELVELITNNWELFYGKFVSLHYPRQSSMDITASLAAKILNKEHLFTLKDGPINLVHMKPLLQGWEVPPISWTDRVGSYFNNNCELKIGNFKQSGVFHYTEKNFLTDQMLETLEKGYLNA